MSLLPRALALMADLHQELALARELQDLRVLLAAAAQPHVVLVVDVDAVLELRPLVARARSAPRDSSVPSTSNSSTGGAARQIDRVSLGCSVDGRCVDPDVIAGIDGDAGDRSKNPVVRQRLRPRRVDAEGGHLAHRRPTLRQRPDRGQREDQTHQRDRYW